MLDVVTKFLLLGFCFSSLSSWAKVSIGNNLSEVSLSVHGVFLKDEHAALNQKEAINAYKNGDFFSPKNGKTRFGLVKDTYWMVTPILNNQGFDQSFAITQRYASTDRIEFWILNENFEVKNYAMGGDKAENQRHSLNHRLPAFKTKFSPGKNYLLVRAQTEGSVNFDITLSSTDSFNTRTLVDYVILSSLLSMLIIMAIYNLLIYFELKKLTYLLYVIFVSSITMQAMAYSGMAKHITDNYTNLTNLFYPLAGNITSVAATLFGYFFLGLKSQRRSIQLVAAPAIVIGIISAFVTFFDYNTGSKLSVLAALFTSLGLIFMGVYMSLKRFRPAYFFTVAWFTVIFFNILRVLSLAGVVQSNFFTEWGVMIGAVIETALISLALADKVRLSEKNSFNRIKNLNHNLRIESDKVKNLNENLEQLVEEQTREISSIMQHIQLGIVVIKGDELSVSSTYSDAAYQIFNVSQLEGVYAIDLLFQNADINKEARDQVASIIESCLGNHSLNFISNEHLFPLEMKYNFGTVTKDYQFSWQIVVDQNEIIEKFIVSVKDITHLKQLESAAKENSRELDLIGEIIDVSTKQFSNFMKSSTDFIADNKRVIIENSKLPTSALKNLFINLHTIKGAARSLGFANLTPMIHNTEQLVFEMMENKREIDRNILRHDHSEIEDMLVLYEQLNSSKLGRNSSDTVSVSYMFLENLCQQIYNFASQLSLEFRSQALELSSELAELTYTSGEVLFKEVLDNSEMLARDLVKEYPVIEIENNHVYFSQKGQEIIRNVFIHVVRNSMDHGIETAEVRKSKGKSPEGHIKVSLDSSGDRLKIVYSDDGQGLNISRIREMAVEKGIIDQNSTYSVEDLAELIFHAGFSTSQDITDISGRGVGMSAVREYFQQIGGTVDLEISEEGPAREPRTHVNFKLIMTLPESYFLVKDNQIKRTA